MKAAERVRRSLSTAADNLRRANNDLGWVGSPNTSGRLHLRGLIREARQSVEQAQCALARLPGIASGTDTFSHGGGI